MSLPHGMGQWISRGLLLVGLASTATGCRYMTNRYYDFRDTFALGAGITAENHITGVPPSLGVLVEVTDFAQLGWVTFNGYVAESDLRGTYVGPEFETRAGFLMWQMVRKNQPYDDAVYYNLFKNKDFPWNYRMADLNHRLGGHAAKELHYEYWADHTFEGTALLHRGWEYWGYTGIEAAISDPLLTHLGLMLRAGIDFSEISDFVLGWFCVDFKHDDMTAEEYEIFRNPRAWNTATAPLQVEPTPPGVTAPPTENMVSKADYDKLSDQNKALQDELAKANARINELVNGIQFTILESVLFKVGSDELSDIGKTALRQMANKIKTDYPGYSITIEGHTDDQPVVVHAKEFKSNWELGSARSNIIVHFMIDQCGLPKKDMITSSFADNKPAVPGITEEARRQNRRAVVVLRATK